MAKTWMEEIGSGRHRRPKEPLPEWKPAPMPECTCGGCDPEAWWPQCQPQPEWPDPVLARQELEAKWARTAALPPARHRRPRPEELVPEETPVPEGAVSSQEVPEGVISLHERRVRRDKGRALRRR
ncbi:hypothetical protein AB0E96_32295 [Kitasatospora sp. NPDC036755]|uniref:hypothetical protein n=1 Tax=Kitasatospora sp. NPDC036755 TaxID=3154600 RepID=UPI0033DEB946